MGESINLDRKMVEVLVELKAVMGEIKKKAADLGTGQQEQKRKEEIASLHQKAIAKLRELLKETYEDQKLDIAAKALVGKAREEIQRLLAGYAQLDEDGRKENDIMSRLNSTLNSPESPMTENLSGQVQNDAEAFILLLEKKISIEKAINKLSDMIQQVLDEVERTN